MGAFEAKTKLRHLLDLVEHGEEVTITRHGKAIAHLGPARAVPSREQASAAAYLELAVRCSLPLATLDEEMRAAGAALGLRLLGAS